MAEATDEWATQGRKNIFGQEVQVTAVSYTHLDVYKRQAFAAYAVSSDSVYAGNKNYEQKVAEQIGVCLLYTSRCV